MRYKLTPEAANDLTEIYVHGFLNFGETQAEKYFSELEDCFEILSKAPMFCRERTELTPPVRIHRILIIRVLHDSMDVKRRLSSM